MGRITGRVLVYETGAPVPNVVVAAFDADASDDLATLRPRAMDRLGSAATDERGAFVFEFGDAEFRHPPDDEPRPDIVIAVYPPDIAEPRGPEERPPLYWSHRARTEAGRDEGFVILLPARLLRERAIPVFGGADTPQPDDPQGFLAKALADRARHAGIVREALRPEIERRATVRRTARQHVLRMMGGTPHPGGLADRFVPAGSDASTTLTAARRSGLARLASLEPRGMRVALTDDVAGALGVERDASGNLSRAHSITRDQFERFFGHAAIGVRVLDPLNACKVTRQLDAFHTGVGNGQGAATPAAPGSSTATEEPIPATPGSAAALAGLVHTEILEHLREAALSLPPGGETGSGMGPDLVAIAKDAIAATLTAELSSGPADGPALHDFHHLQVAWDSVWTAVVDEHLAGKMAGLYQTIVETVDWGTSEPDLSEVNELERFLAMLEESLEVSAGLFAADAGAGTSVIEAEEKIHQGKSLLDVGRDLLSIPKPPGGGLDGLTKKGEQIIEKGGDLIEDGVDAVTSIF